MLRIGVLGAGHLGKIHIRQILELSDYSLVGFYDPDLKKCKEAEAEFGIKPFGSMEELISAVDVVDIVTPTLSHYQCAITALSQNKHIFIEKPLTYSTTQADELVHLVAEKKIKAQVGHVERFNPAFVAAQKLNLQPVYLDASRISQYNPRGTDVSVVLDLMIHDIDILLNLVQAPVARIDASGVPVISQTPDIANARITFENGVVANLTASRASIKNERKMRMFQKNAYISLDFLNKKASIYKLDEHKNGEVDPFAIVLETPVGEPDKIMSFENLKTEKTNAIREELRLFAQCIEQDTEPAVSITDGFRSLRLAHQILEQINLNLNKIKNI